MQARREDGGKDCSVCTSVPAKTALKTFKTGRLSWHSGGACLRSGVGGVSRNPLNEVSSRVHPDRFPQHVDGPELMIDRPISDKLS